MTTRNRDALFHQVCNVHLCAPPAQLQRRWDGSGGCDKHCQKIRVFTLGLFLVLVAVPVFFVSFFHHLPTVQPPSTTHLDPSQTPSSSRPFRRHSTFREDTPSSHPLVPSNTKYPYTSWTPSTSSRLHVSVSFWCLWDPSRRPPSSDTPRCSVTTTQSNSRKSQWALGQRTVIYSFVRMFHAHASHSQRLAVTNALNALSPLASPIALLYLLDGFAHAAIIAFFSQNVPHEGQLYFQFVTSYNNEHQYLEEFQMHRRVFGVCSPCWYFEHVGYSMRVKKNTYILPPLPYDYQIGNRNHGLSGMARRQYGGRIPAVPTDPGQGDYTM